MATKKTTKKTAAKKSAETKVPAKKATPKKTPTKKLTAVPEKKSSDATVAQEREFEIDFDGFSVRNTDSTLYVRGFVKASDVDEAERLAWEDFRSQEWTEIEIGDAEEFDGAETDGRMKYWSVNFSMKGRHGEYFSTAMPYALDERSAQNKTRKDLARGGIEIDGAYVEQCFPTLREENSND